MRWHCPPDTGFEIRALAVWGRARYLSVTEAPQNTSFTRGWGRNTFVSFKSPRPGTEPRTLWKAAVLTTTLDKVQNQGGGQYSFSSMFKFTTFGKEQCHLVHGPDRVTVHPPRTVWDQVFIVPWTSPDIKSRCHQKKVGMDYLFWAAIEIWKSRFVP